MNLRWGEVRDIVGYVDKLREAMGSVASVITLSIESSLPLLPV
jgi:hypothetical protein